MFKYLTAATTRAVLERRTLRWSTPRTFNDPFDVQFDLRIEVDRVEVRRLALLKMWDDHYGPDPGPAGNPLGNIIRALRGRFPQWDREEFEANFADAIEEGMDRGFASLPRLQADTREHLRDSKILCMTAVPDNVLMWTHYADQHTGAVLRFRDVPDLDSPWKEAIPIDYVNEVPLLADNDALSDIMAGRATFDMPLMIRRLVYTKSNVFAYEREWRLYSGAGRNPDADFEDLGFHPLELDAVIIGPRTSVEDQAAILDLTRQLYPHATLQRAVLEPGSFAMTIGPI